MATSISGKKWATSSCVAAIILLLTPPTPRASPEVGGLRGAVYVGDSDVDIETARNSGLPCISVLWGFRDRDFLLQHGATTFVASPAELLRFR